MARFFRHNFFGRWCRSSRWLLACVWCCGLALGIYVFWNAGDSSASLMRMAANSPVSIVSLLSVLIFPFLASAAAVLLYKPWLLLAAAFVKAYALAFLSLAVICAFSSAGWLVRLLLMFSQFLSVPLLCWFWIHYISGRIRPAPAVLFLMAALIMLIGSVDYCIVSPFLAGLIEF